MTIEAVTYVSDLNVAYPGSSDNISEGDNHLRNIKTALKNTFPNVTGAVTPTHTELNTDHDKVRVLRAKMFYYLGSL